MKCITDVNTGKPVFFTGIFNYLYLYLNILERSRLVGQEPEGSSRSRSPLKRVIDIEEPAPTTKGRSAERVAADNFMRPPLPPPGGRSQGRPAAISEEEEKGEDQEKEEEEEDIEEDEEELRKKEQNRKSRSKTRRPNKNATQRVAPGGQSAAAAAADLTMSIQVRANLIRIRILTCYHYAANIFMYRTVPVPILVLQG